MEKLKFKTNKTFTDITDRIVPKGDACLIFTTHTTCGLAILENEEFLIKDMEGFLERVAPKKGIYAHDDIKRRPVPPDERINGHSHIKAMLFSPSIVVPVVDNKLLLGKWQSIFLVELDPRREREVYVRPLKGV